MNLTVLIMTTILLLLLLLLLFCDGTLNVLGIED